MTKIKVVCLFARQLGLETLREIIDDGLFDVIAVITHYYESKSYSERTLFGNYVTFCNCHNIPLLVVGEKQESLNILEELEFDFLVANCYKYSVPSNILNLPKIESLNMHRSLLPKYKGLKPIKRALENKESKTGTTTHIMNQSYDSGEIIDQYEIPIQKGDTELDVLERLYPTQYPLFKRVLLKLGDIK